MTWRQMARTSSSQHAIVDSIDAGSYLSAYAFTVCHNFLQKRTTSCFISLPCMGTDDSSFYSMTSPIIMAPRAIGYELRLSAPPCPGIKKFKRPGS